MPPQQTSMPASRTIRSVSQRSSHVCVVTTFGKYDRRSPGCGCSGARPSRPARRPAPGVSMPRSAATLMSTAARIAATPSRICSISRSSGPRTAATMQNSVAPVAAVCSRRLDQRRDVQPDRAHRRGEQAGLRAEVAVLRAAAGLQRDDALDLDLGAAPAHPHLVGELRARRAASSSGSRSTSSTGLVEADALGRGRGRGPTPGSLVSGQQVALPGHRCRYSTRAYSHSPLRQSTRRPATAGPCRPASDR